MTYIRIQIPYLLHGQRRCRPRFLEWLSAVGKPCIAVQRASGRKGFSTTIADDESDFANSSLRLFDQARWKLRSSCGSHTFHP